MSFRQMTLTPSSWRKLRRLGNNCLILPPFNYQFIYTHICLLSSPEAELPLMLWVSLLLTSGSGVPPPEELFPTGKWQDSSLCQTENLLSALHLLLVLTLPFSAQCLEKAGNVWQSRALVSYLLLKLLPLGICSYACSEQCRRQPPEPS